MEPSFTSPVRISEEMRTLRALVVDDNEANLVVARLMLERCGCQVETVTGGERPEVKVPTVFVAYRLEPSGNAFASTRPRGIFMGLVFFFYVRVVVPGTEEPFLSKHTLDVKVPVRMLLDMEKPYPKGGEIERMVYDAMLKDGLSEVQERYFEPWYR